MDEYILLLLWRKRRAVKCAVKCMRKPRIRRCLSSSMNTRPSLFLWLDALGDASWTRRHLTLSYRFLKMLELQLVATSFVSRGLSLLLDWSCNEIQLILQLADVDNSSHTYSTHQRATMHRPATTTLLESNATFWASSMLACIYSISLFLCNLLHKKGLKSALFHSVLAFMPRLNEG